MIPRGIMGCMNIFLYVFILFIGSKWDTEMDDRFK